MAFGGGRIIAEAVEEQTAESLQHLFHKLDDSPLLLLRKYSAPGLDRLDSLCAHASRSKEDAALPNETRLPLILHEKQPLSDDATERTLLFQAKFLLITFLALWAIGVLHYAASLVSTAYYNTPETDLIIPLGITAFIYALVSPGLRKPESLTVMNEQPAALNPSNDQAFFIKQQYIDCLGRVAEPAGFQFWFARVATVGAPQFHDYRAIVNNFLRSDEYNFRFAFIPAS